MSSSLCSLDIFIFVFVGISIVVSAATKCEPKLLPQRPNDPPYTQPAFMEPMECDEDTYINFKNDFQSMMYIDHSRNITQTIALVTDIHYAKALNHGNRHYNQSLLKLTEALQVLETMKPDLIVEMGDFKDMNPLIPTASETLGFLDTVEAMFMASSIPMKFHVLGNHDVDTITKDQFCSHTKSSGIDRVERYYSYNINRMHYIVLDGNYGKNGSNLYGNNVKWNELYFPDVELNWLKRDLLLAKNHNVIVFIHERIDSPTSDWGKSCCLRNAVDVRSVLEASGNVLAVFQGHDHAGVDSPMNINGISYYTLKGMVEGPYPTSSSYAAARIFDDCSIDVIGFRTAKNATFLKPTKQHCFLG